MYTDTQKYQNEHLEIEEFHSNIDHIFSVNRNGCGSTSGITVRGDTMQATGALTTYCFGESSRSYVRERSSYDLRYRTRKDVPKKCY